ncbi:MAG: DsbA family protein, partial [Pseudomonadales bacterium]|nr:DsbA family protein [Pseudomonadales bacterium]
AAAAGRTARQVLDEGDALLKRRGHYLGAMFYFEGEWYWGLDRLYHLERRLRESGFDTRPAAGPCVPRPTGISASGVEAAGVSLEYFPSLRSPYTAISYARTMDLVDRSGVTLRLRPVMPMMMRGVPAPRAKQFYIIMDTKREAEAAGVPFGKVVDPFGDPVRRAFSLYPTLERLGKGREYLGSYLSAAFAEGIDITLDAGLAQVVERIGVPWSNCAAALGSAEYIAVVEENLQALSSAGLWGVPSFRVSGGARDGTFQCWGQDRLWRVETEIALRSGRTETPETASNETPNAH